LATVFIGPCVAKIEEARHPAVAGAVDGVLGFPELRAWWREAGVDPSALPEEEFDSPPTTLGKLYPVPGGLLRTAALRADVLDNDIRVVEGREKSLEFLRALERGEVGGTFVDILFCEGCVNGPLAGSALPAYGRRDRVVQEVRSLSPGSLRLAEPPPGLDLSRDFLPRPVHLPEPDEAQIRAILRELGKTRPEDELNCGACGYSSCREKAVAVYQGLAENKMCLPYLISELQARNAELAYLRDYNRNIVESIAEGIIVTDRDGIITVFNDPRHHVSDRPRDELLGRKLFLGLPHLDREEVRKVFSAVLEEGRVGAVPELRYQLGGRLVVSSLRAYPLRGEQGQLLGAVVICQDITEEKRWFSRLAESDRLASLGRLAAGVAHEINNPLTLVSGYAELLRDSVADPQLREQAAVIVEEVQRIAGIVRNLLTFARQQPATAIPCDVNGILGRLCSLTASQFQKAKVELMLRCEPGLPQVVANPGELEQVFLNLMINALEAMPRGGRLTVDTQCAHVDGGPWVEIRFADTGCGIKEEYIDRIFEPFFTTKEVGKGTGLGLSVSYGIVRKYGGTIDVSSEEGRGSVFVVRLPARAGVSEGG
jgi:PAS domain S-box-containing protein